MPAAKSPEKMLPRVISGLIYECFQGYLDAFSQLTQKAQARFVCQEWDAIRRDARQRLYVYKEQVDKVITMIDERAGGYRQNQAVWERVKEEYKKRIEGHDAGELAGTFFNSVTRKIFQTVGVNVYVEFTIADFAVPMLEDRFCPVCHLFFQPEGIREIEALVSDILARYRHELPYGDMDRDACRIASAIRRKLKSEYGIRTIRHIEMMSSVFYREMAAYLIGRIRVGDRIVPLAISFLKQNDQIRADAVLLKEKEISILFSFARSYFHVGIFQLKEMVNFLKTILPQKKISEIYTSIGFFKHGKAEFYRELTRALQNSAHSFDVAPGKRGMVMLVFAIPSFDVVFKVIRDTFDYPKQTSQQAVRGSYELVFSHHRAGRLIDAQEFKNIRFDRSRFTKELLEELVETAGRNVVLSREHVVIKHMYIERRLTPLDLYLAEVPDFLARKAVVDYGQCIKDLAVSNIFPGDLFLKNFGVTRHGRVVFYDYDEISLVTECVFKRIPASRSDDEEYSSEVWFSVGENDVFPEEFKTFIGIPPRLRGTFEARHADLFTVEYWQGVKSMLLSGSAFQVLPYEETCRLQ